MTDHSKCAFNVVMVKGVLRTIHGTVALPVSLISSGVVLSGYKILNIAKFYKDGSCERTAFKLAGAAMVIIGALTGLTSAFILASGLGIGLGAIGSHYCGKNGALLGLTVGLIAGGFSMYKMSLPILKY